MPFPTVYDFMSGYAQAITESNDALAGTTITAAGDEYQEITL